MPLSVHAAARYSGNTTSAVVRAIISGRLPASRQPDGTYQIAENDLDRTFPVEGRHRLAAFGPIFPPSNPSEPGSLAAIMEAELAGLIEILHRADTAFARAFLGERA
ncbi:MAG: hypothetical protein JNM20_01510 [Rhizobiales bacterium]|nr:hypothetical protein [Hyphomicrobiales bacterium]